MIRPEVSYFDSRPAERPLANALGEAFDITRAQAWNGYSLWLAQPLPPTRERFGLNQEVLVLYSRYPTNDARVITAIERVFRDPEYANRADRVLVLLVHRSDQLATTQLVETQADRVIVPLEADRLGDANRGDLFVRSAIAGRLGATDLFGMSSPITSGKYFFGRERLLRELEARAFLHRQNSGVFGLRKTGKTSVLFALQREIVNRPVQVQYVDCQNPGIHAARWWEVLAQIAERCCNRTSTGYTQPGGARQFTSDILGLLQNGVDHVLIMLDEIEYITPGVSGNLGSHWDEDCVPFWQTIRATHQESEGRLTFIVAGVNPSAVQQPHFSSTPNPIFQLATPHYLEPLPVDDVRTMVRTIGRYSGLQFDEPVYAYLQRRYGGHPYLIRTACSEVWRHSDTLDAERRARVSLAIFAGIDADLASRVDQPVKDILLSLVWWYPDEYALLQILAEGDDEFVRDYLTQNPESLLQFARYGILREYGEFAIEDVRHFLRTRGEDYKREVSPFLRSDMPPELLPTVVDIDTVGALFAKRSEIEARLRKAIYMYLGVKFGWDEPRIARALAQGLPRRDARREPADLFVGRRPQDAMNELYVPDLKAIVLEHWDVFSTLFDGNRGRFEMNIDTLNIARRVDAHTKPVSRQEALDFTNSYGWLLARLERVPSL